MTRFLEIRLVPLLILLTGCEDYSQEIGRVKSALVRDVAGSGETRSDTLRQSVEEYLEIEFALLQPTVAWSAERAPAMEGVDSIIVSATYEPQATYLPDTIMPDEIVMRFSYVPTSARVEFAGMTIDAERAMLRGTAGAAKLVDGYEAVVVVMEERTRQLIATSGQPLKTNESIPTFGQVQKTPTNP